MFDFMVWRSRFAGPTEYEIDHRTAKKQTTMYCTPCPHYVATNSPMSAWRTRFDVARKNKNKQNKQTKTSATGSAPQENQTTMYARPHYVATNSLMSAWCTRLAECAATIAVFAFVRSNAASPLPLSSAAASRTPK